MTEEMALIPKSTYDYLLTLREQEPSVHEPKKITHLTQVNNNQEDLQEGINTLPKNTRNRAKGLLNYIREKGGNLIRVDQGQIIMKGKSYGHVIDFLRHAVSTFDLKQTPKGMKEFYTLLRKLNAPLYYTPSKMVLPGKRNVKKWIELPKKV